MSGRVIVLMAVACGVSVANVYFAQPLLPEIGRSLSLDTAHVGLVGAIGQVGYLVGLVCLVPFGDRGSRRALIPLQCLGGGVALIAAAVAPTRVLFLVAVAVVGACACVVQLLVAFAAVLSDPAHRGRSVGLVTSGVVTGILVSRTGAGALGELLGWRAVYLTAGALSLGLALLLAVALPADPFRSRVPYRRLTLSVVTLSAGSPTFRARAAIAFLLFAGFATLWNSLALPLSDDPWHLSAAQIGLFGFAGLAGATAAARAGALSDRGHSTVVTGAALAIMLGSWALIAQAPHSLVVLVAGIILLDLAVQAVHVTNQNLIVAIDPQASSRIIGSYMAYYSVGSAAGALASTAAYDAGGWTAVSLLGAGLAAAALALWAAQSARVTRRVECEPAA